MAKITINKLTCERKQDITGQDEPVIYIAGQEVWEGKMGKGDTRTVDETRNFVGNVYVELKEKDKKKSKLLDSWTISDNDSVDEKMLTASSSGFHYKLWYSVESDAA